MNNTENSAQMTLDEAIDHLKESLNDQRREWCDECKKEHYQLLNWLYELRKLRKNKVIRHGHWIYDKDAECMYCSYCTQFNANESINIFSVRSKYCSRCGAIMDEPEVFNL